MKKYYLFGQGISRSFSPEIHSTCFKYLKTQSTHTYQIYQTSSAVQCFSLLQTPDFAGASITMPYKQSFFGTVPYKGVAQVLKNINTIVKKQDNQISRALFEGYNTDYHGIRQTLDSIKHIEKALILGAGATSETFIQYLSDRKVKSIHVGNRSQNRLKALTTKFECITPVQLNRPTCEYDLIVSTLPPTADFSLDSSYFKSKPAVMEVAYNTLYTPILLQGLKYDCKVLPGILMLISQGLAQNELFTGKPLDKDQIRRQLIWKYHTKYNIPWDSYWRNYGIDY